MSHVDDGMLHGYLDGALSALDAVRVERHVAECAACRQRLEGARALIQRAARLLEWAGPPVERAAPPLAAITPVAVPQWRVPVAWAATIVIALGAGIYGGRILLRSGGTHNGERIANREIAAAPPTAAPINVVADTPRREMQAPTPTPEPVPPAAPAATNLATPPTPAAAGAGARETTAALQRLADAAASAKARADSVPADAPVARDSLVNANRLAERRFAAQEAPAPAAAAPRAMRAESAPTWTTITNDSARVLLGTAPVTLPDLPVSSIRTLNGAVAVEQVAPPGRVIRLVQRRAGADEEQARAPSDALARYLNGLRVEITGPMPAESLSVMLGRAR